jgi:hypothetical protein
MRTWHAAAAAAGAAAALAVGGFGVAEALTAIPPNTLHGCINTNQDRRLDRVYVNPLKGTACPTGEIQVIWPNGPTTAGPAGLGAEQVVNETTVSYPDGTYADVLCPSDHPYVISGGGFVDDNSASLRDSYPVIPGPGGQFPQGWEVAVTFPVALGLDGRTSATVRVYAICSR